MKYTKILIYGFFFQEMEYIMKTTTTFVEYIKIVPKAYFVFLTIE